MWAYIQRRLITMVLVLLGVSLVVFMMLHFLPGDPGDDDADRAPGARRPRWPGSVGRTSTRRCGSSSGWTAAAGSSSHGSSGAIQRQDLGKRSAAVSRSSGSNRPTTCRSRSSSPWSVSGWPS